MNNTVEIKVVVEGELDATILRAILDKAVAGRIRFFAARGRASLATVGRNILIHEGGPVLLVLDSNTRDKHLADEVQSMAGVAMSGAMPPSLTNAGVWYRVFAFVPALEVVFFEAPQAFESLVGKKISEPTVQQGLLAPKETLMKTLGETGKTYQTLLASIGADVASKLVSGVQAQALRATIESMLGPASTVYAPNQASRR